MARLRKPGDKEPNFKLNRVRAMMGMKPILRPGVEMDLSLYAEPMGRDDED
jgi:hypothetical protein